MNRPRSYTIAAVLMVLYSLVSLMFEVPNLMRGAVDTPDAPPFFLTILNFVVAILGFVSAYGVWRAEKWGVVLMIILAALGILTALPAIIFAPTLDFRLIGGLSILWSAVIIVLVLRPGPKTTTA